MAVAYRSSSTIQANGELGVDFAAALPSGLAIDDIMIFVGGNDDAEHFNLGMPLGWTVIFSDNAEANFGGTIAWKRYDGTEWDWVFDTPTNAGQLVMGVIHAFSGCIKNANPIVGLQSQAPISTTNHNTLAITGYTGQLAVYIFAIEDDVAVTKLDLNGTWTERDNQTTIVGSDGRLICSTSVSTGTISQRYTTGTSEYSFGVEFRLVAEDYRSVITPNTADAFDFGADNTPTLEFTGDDLATSNQEYQVQILSAQNVICDSYSESNQSSIYLYQTKWSAYAQSFTGNGGVLSKATFYIRKSGTATGFARARLYAHSGTFGTNSIPTGVALATSNTLDVSTLTTSLALKDFLFDTDLILVNGTKYCIALEYNGFVTSNTLEIGLDTTSSTHAGNYSDRSNLNNWSSNSYDLCFYVYTHTVHILDQFSSIPSGKFLNTVTGTDLHPFTDNQKVSYTVGEEKFDESTGLTATTKLGDGTTIGYAHSFTGVDGILNSVNVNLSSNFGSPTGNVVAKLYAHSGTFGTSSIPTGTALATSDNVDVTTIISGQNKFIFSSPYTMVAGTKYVFSLEYSGGDASNYMNVKYNTGDATHEGNYASSTGSWTASSTWNLLFQLYLGQTLADGTWYWRARAQGQYTNGVNAWSDWSAIRSFTISSATNVSKIKVGSWKDFAAAPQINIGGVWKSVTAVKINIGGVWKDVDITP